MGDKCEKCEGYLYSGWHTNCPGKDLGKEADNILCLMLGMRNEGHKRQLALAREREATEKARADKAEAALPATFYAGESLDFRIARMVEIWNRAIEATKEAEARLETLASQHYTGGVKGLVELLDRLRQSEAEARQLRKVYTIFANLAGLLQYEVVERVFFAREVDLFKDATIGPKLCAGKTLLEVLNEALAAKEANDG